MNEIRFPFATSYQVFSFLTFIFLFHLISIIRFFCFSSKKTDSFVGRCQAHDKGQIDSTGPIPSMLSALRLYHHHQFHVCAGFCSHDSPASAPRVTVGRAIFKMITEPFGGG